MVNDKETTESAEFNFQWKEDVTRISLTGINNGETQGFFKNLNVAICVPTGKLSNDV